MYAQKKIPLSISIFCAGNKIINMELIFLFIGLLTGALAAGVIGVLVTRSKMSAQLNAVQTELGIEQEKLKSLISANAVPAAQVPQPGHFVRRSTDSCSALLIHVHRNHNVGVPLHGAHTLAGAKVPEPHCLV